MHAAQLSYSHKYDAAACDPPVFPYIAQHRLGSIVSKYRGEREQLSHEVQLKLNRSKTRKKNFQGVETGAVFLKAVILGPFQKQVLP